MLTILLVILVFGLLVFVHEFGHFIVAKRSGIKVEEFGFGFPPRIFSFKKGETVYSLNAVPLGGFVKIFGEQGEGEKMRESFSSRGVGLRSFVVVSGVLMNILLAFVLFSLVFSLGAPVVITDQNSAFVSDRAITVVRVQPETPAAIADLRMGDMVTGFSADGKSLSFSVVPDFQKLTRDFAGQEIIVTIRRGDEVLEKRMIPRQNPPEGQGPLGIALAETGIVKYGIFRSVFEGFKTTFSLLYFIFLSILKLLGRFIFQFVVPTDITGPIGIGVFIHQATQMGVQFLINLTAIISLNLAVLNILPLPALDGGRLLFFFIEALRGRKVNHKTENLIHVVGFVILIGLAILVTIRDIRIYF